MRCTSPRTVGFKHDGSTISWSPKTTSKEFVTWQLPCSKCLSCRLEYARTWAIRCVHEAAIHDQNSFITLTYSDENLKSPRLNYTDFQLFVKKLRDHIFQEWLEKHFPKNYYKNLSKQQKKQFREDHRNELDKQKIGIFVTGEYGDQNKRPHWHAIIFNWRPTDTQHHYTNDKGDKVFTSEILTKLWNQGHAEIGSVTFESAGYVARYAAKKLGHGNDQNHDYHPISKKSSHQAIGKRWLEQYWPDVFNYGEIILDTGQKAPIPRYYQKWLQKHKPDEWRKYVTITKLAKMEAAQHQTETELERYREEIRKRGPFKGTLATRNRARKIILESKFKQLQNYLKL